MKKFLKSSAFKLILGVLSVASGVILYTASEPNNNILSNVLNAITVPAKKVLWFVSDATFSFAHQFAEKENLKSENESLKSEIAKLRDIKIDYDNLKRENARFKKYYGIKKENKSLKFVSACVVGKEPTDIFGDFILDKGTSSGVSLNDAVITENGFVGRICQVSACSSRVKTILSPEAKIGVIDSSTGDSGVISGSGACVQENLTRMIFIPAHSAMQTDDIVTTSGISGMYPKNLKLGKIRSIEYDEYESSHYALIEPFEKIKCVKDVFIITDFDGKGLMSVLKNDKN